MKKVAALLIAAMVVIAICLVLILKRGVSLRSAPVIAPTLLSTPISAIARALIVRLTPEFQSSEISLIAIYPSNNWRADLLEHLKVEFARDFKVAPNVLKLDEASAEDLANCQKPCWILTDLKFLSDGNFSQLLKSRLKSSPQNYFTLRFVDFNRAEKVPLECETQKRISLECIRPLSIRESIRKMKEPAPYFFMRKYNEIDYFLFIEHSF